MGPRFKSCRPSGDLSFATAFRERSRATSLVQVGGRVNRHGERAECAVWDFIVNDPLLTAHPDFRDSRDIVEELFHRGMWNQNLTDLMTYALEQEFKRHSKENQIDDLLKQETQGSYPKVSDLTRLIDSDTRLVVIDGSLIEALRQGIIIDRHTLLANSVQLWSTKIQKLALNEIDYCSELYAWEYDYDEHFLGIMEGVLKLMEMEIDGYAII